MDNIHQCSGIFYHCICKFTVISVPVGILDIIVYPQSVKEIQGIRIIMVIFPHGIIETVVLYRIYADAICPHILYFTEPSQIRLFINRIICSKMAGNPNSHIYPSDLKGL